MGKSERLRLRDVRAIFRLISECRELGDDSRAWRKHLLRELSGLVGAQVAAGGEVYGFLSGRPQSVLLISLGWDDAKAEALWQTFVEEEDPDVGPLFERVFRLVKRRGGLVTRVRQQLLRDHEWFNSGHFSEYRRPSNANESLYSYYALPSNGVDAISVLELYRALKGRPFRERERRLVRLLHDELCPLIGRQLAAATEPSGSELSPRLQQVLGCLLEGDGEKQIAYRLELSRATVHEYVTAIYRHFGVHSRAELMARWLRFRRAQTHEE